MTAFAKRILVLSAIGAAGLLGSVLAGRALRDAIASTEALYRVDTAGLQLESTLEYETQESRRAFLYALATTDPNDQLPYIDEARLASERVHEATLRLEALGLEEISNCLRRFDRSWRTYSQVRDEIVAHILEGQSDRAIQAERMRGQSSFLAAIQNLHDLRSTLARHVNEKSAQVDRTLRTCAAGLGAFTLCTIFIVGALTKLSRDRHAALEGLWASNEALAAQTEMEERKAAILEMVSIQEPLSHTLGTIVELAPRCAEGAGAAIWSATGAELSFQVACNLPAACIARLQESPLPLAEEHSVLWAELEMGHRTLAAEFGLDTAESKALRDGAGKAIGMLEVLIPPGGRVHRHVVDQIAQLATVAIENKLLYERLAFQAQHDMLTQLPNRASFQNQVEQAAALSMRHGKKLAVLWIDLDRYKQVNDTLGHRVGDEVLCEVARRLKDCLRKSDVVARAGGDEFTVLAYDLASVADAETVAEKILGSLVRPMLLGEHEVAISGSVGISIFPDHGNEPALLLRNADLAMYAAKRAGGNAFSIFQPDLGASLQHRVEIERELRNALERNEFWLEYQPLMNREGGVAGLEALLRWNNPALGRVSPADFIPIAEEMGLIIPIGEWVLRAACQDGAYWSAMSCEVPRIAVNVSAVQLVNKGFRAIVETALRTYGFPANKLEIEITETALMNNLEQATGHMDPLRHLGVRFSVDDFGTGYSSLNQLRTLPVDALKIDRSFIRDLEPSGSGCSTLVEGIIALAHSLNLEVVAEGVETTSQLDLLRSLGCDIYQGFLLARPMPAHQVEALLRRNSPAVEEQLNLVPSLA